MSVLLDTCALIWLGNGAPMSTAALDRVEAARLGGGVHVSAISAWEIGLAASRDRSSLQLLPDPVTWLGRVMAQPGLRALALDQHVALASTMLPDWQHRDPADRLIVATARILNMLVVTRDSRILAYADAGHVRAIAC